MNRIVKTAASAAVICAVAAPALAQQSGPKAVYWVDAATTAGMGGMMGAMMSGGDAREAAMAQAMQEAQDEEGQEADTGSMLGGALGGDAGAALGSLFGGGKKKPKPQAQARPAPQRRPATAQRANYTHTLNLHLGATQKAPSPSAEHLPPAGLQAGPSLPLVTPVSARPQPTYDSHDWGAERPKGKMLIYWGCGEHAAAPIVIDFAKMGPGMKAPNFPTIAANPGTPPAPGRHATYGEWPNERSQTTVPAQGSLVGEHTVRGNYSPEIRFTVDPGHDFLAPLNITSGPSAGGGALVSWNAVPNATGYYAYMMGAGGENDTMVMWSSSATAAFMGALMDYLPPSEVRRLITAKAVMAPTTTQCIVPSEVMRASPMGMLTMIAYGDELNVSNPPRPAGAKPGWQPDYTVKVRLKSTGSTMLGMNMG